MQFPSKAPDYFSFLAYSSPSAFLFAAVIAYAAGALTLTRNFVLPTYLTLGLASAYLEIGLGRLPDRYIVSAGWFFRLAVGSVAGLIGLKLLTQVLGQFGV